MEKTIEKVNLTQPIIAVVENLPPIATLRHMAKYKTLTSTVIHGEEWELSVTDTEEPNSLKREENMKEIIFTKIKTEKNGTRKQQGIFTDNDFGLVLGIITGSASLRVDQPENLAKMMLELKNKPQAEQSATPFPKNNN